jgi:eight-cysteine-cluster-containing protein
MFAVVAMGCSDGDDISLIQKDVSLQAFSSCDELEKYIEDTAVKQMREMLTPVEQDDFVAAPRSPSDSAAETAGSPNQPSAYTTTNNQVAGVNEADIMKNDGNRIFVLSRDTLYASQSWPAEALQLAGKLKIEGVPSQMLLRGNSIVVFSNIYEEMKAAPAAGASGMVCDAAWGCRGDSYKPMTKITVVDVSSLKEPKAIREWYIPGAYVKAVNIESSVKLVLQEGMVWPADVPLSQGGDAGDVDAQMEKYEKAIRAHALKDWVRPAQTKEGASVIDMPLQCTQFYRDTGNTRMGFVTVASFDVDDLGATPQGITVTGEAYVVYASLKSLYIAHPHWWQKREAGQSTYTYLHKLDVSQKGMPVYAASGGVEGHILNSFSMDEAPDGHLRLATHLSTVKEGAGRWDFERKNRVSVHAQRGNRIEEVGRTADMAEGEQIYSARFLGNKGFVVTFRTIDPLFTIDLSNPAEPKVVGELKVPGVSTYIHPLGENHLLTIGMDVDTFFNGVKLSLFDVSDFAHPKEAFTLSWSKASGGHSDALYEHKAFNYFPERKLLAVPFTHWSQTSNPWDTQGLKSELRLVRVDVESGFKEEGAVSMADLYWSLPTDAWTYAYTPVIQRSVMADDYVYAVSSAGIRAAKMGALSKPVATVEFTDVCTKTPSVSSGDALYDRVEAPSANNACAQDSDCMVSGCSAEICAAQAVVSTCELVPRPKGGCGCVEGSCVWHTAACPMLPWEGQPVPF